MSRDRSEWNRPGTFPWWAGTLSVPSPASKPWLPLRFVPEEKRLTHGEVHDENAFLLGGVAGHAGLFGTARDVGVWADTLLGFGNHEGWVQSSTIRTFWGPIPSPDDSTWRLGFDGVSPNGSSGGNRVSPDGVCHLGFTGTSVWFDPSRRCSAVLLTNRVHPSRTNDQIRRFRPVVHDAIWRAVDEIG